MPVHPVRNDKGEIIGYKYGKTGKVYASKEDAEKQGRAIKASQAQRYKRRKKYR